MTEPNPSRTSPEEARPAADGPQLRCLLVAAMAFTAGDIATPAAAAPAGPEAPWIRAGDSLFHVVRHLVEHPEVHVQGPAAEWGVITRQDLQKIPCRTWLFGMVSAVELYFVQRIRDRWPDDAWTRLVNPERLEKARQVQELRNQRGARCGLLECLQLSDKAEILVKDPEELALLGFPSRSRARQAMHNLESFRNHLVHSQEIVDSHWTQLTRLVALVSHFLNQRAEPGAAIPDLAGLPAFASLPGIR